MKVTYYIQNSTANTGATADPTDPSILLTANTGYKFKEVPTVNFFDSNTGSYEEKFFVLASDNKTATFNENLSVFGVDDGIQIYAETEKDNTTQPETYTAKYHLTNCTTDAPKYFTDISNLNITITAQINGVFNEPPTINLLNENDADFVTKTAVLYDNNTVAKFENLDLTSYLFTEFEVYATAEQKGGDVVPNFGSINVYQVSTEILDSFASLRYVQNAGTGNSTPIDLGQYINAVRQMYFNVENTAFNANLQFGDYGTTIKAPIPKTKPVILTFTPVMLSGENNNATDYDAEITIFLPFVGFKQLNDNYVDKMVGIDYIIDVVTGEGIVKIRADGVVLEIFDCSPYRNVIYRNNTETGILGQLGNRVDILKGLRPYIIYKWFTDTQSDVNNDSRKAVINELTGFIRCDDVNLQQSERMNKTDIENIIFLLKTGIVKN